MLCLLALFQTGPPRLVDCLTPPPAGCKKDGGILLSALPKDTASELAGFSFLRLLRVQSSRTGVNTVLKSLV